MKKLTLLLVLLSVAFAGCYKTPKKSAPGHSSIFNRYDAIVLPQEVEDDEEEVVPTTSEEVMDMIKNESLEEYLSQSEDLVCSWGQRDNASAGWLNLVVFDEDSSLVDTKCGIVYDQDAPGWGVLLLMTGTKFRMDLQTVNNFPAASDYQSVSEYNVAVLEAIYDDLGDSIDSIAADGQALKSAKLTINSVFSQMFEQLDRTPAAGENITSEKGFIFDHITMGYGNLHIVIEDDLVTLKLTVKTKASDYADSENPL